MRLVTLKEIAEEAKLSIGTVDRVLHGRGRVSKTTEAKIRTILKKHNYQTNIHARNLSLKTTHEFGVIIPCSERDSDYWEILQKGIDRAITELSAFRISRRFFFFDRYSEASFRDACDNALKENMAGLVIAPVHEDACRSFVAGIFDKVPYVFVDSMVAGTAPLSFIGQDSFRSGVCGARLMQLAVGGTGEVAVLRMLPNDQHIDNRVRGFRSFFENHPTISAGEHSINGGCDDREFIRQVHAIEDAFPHCRGYFITNAAAYRVVRALQLSGNSTAKVIGYDCTEENRRLLGEGYISFIISQKTEQQGYLGIHTLCQSLVLRMSCAREVYMPIDIVMKENLPYYQ